MSDIIHLKSVSDITKLLGVNSPKHPLAMVIPNHCLDLGSIEFAYMTNMYIVSMKHGLSGRMKYGRGIYDFNDGMMVFLAPEQVISPIEASIDEPVQGWTVIFHPDLIRRTSLGNKIHQYTFFSYDINEALHISESEIQTVRALIDNILKELDNNIDKHTERLICGSLELLLNYCSRFYDRQFFTRSNFNKDKLAEFESFLRHYYANLDVVEHGLPSVAYCGKQLGMSPNYLSDLLKKETGKTAKEHIQLFVIELAKNKLLGSSQTISQIAYDLGFEYPAHFTKLFKNNTGYSPSQYRKVS
ncbi:AraC family transcriptional regulator [Alteromonadaceae bacterium M269]|nr:AraC family transcriptional regulator [Alteromonadaceae bacterium M269]